MKLKRRMLVQKGYYCSGMEKLTMGNERGYHIIVSLFVHENICCGYSLEAPRRGASNEYPQLMFSWRNKTKHINTFRLKKTKQKKKKRPIWKSGCNVRSHVP